MYIADILSRASISSASLSTSEFEVFCTELISYTEHMKVSDTRLDQIQGQHCKATEVKRSGRNKETTEHYQAGCN